MFYQYEDDPIQIVKPTCIQMGWSKSPPLFCSACKMAQDIAQEMLDKQTPLPSHPLKSFCLPKTIQLPDFDQINSKTMTKLLNIYMDDFISLAQAPTQEELCPMLA